MRVLLIAAAAAAASVFQPPATQSAATAPPPATDIYLVPLANGLGSMKLARPAPVATAPGYENQPMFSADGGRILFAANRGGQTDVYVFDRATGRTSQLTNTPENENSPTYLPAGIGEPGGFSVVRTEPDRTQRLWRFDAQGRNPQVVLTDVKPVGYHAWVDADRVALYVLGQPATLRIAGVKSGAADVVASNIGRSLHRVPGTAAAVSFVQREASGEWWIKQIDAASKAIVPLVKAVDGSTDRDMAWMPDGRALLMSSGTKVLSWTRGASGWTEVFDAAAHSLGAVSRLAVSPRGDAVAIVVAESQASVQSVQYRSPAGVEYRSLADTDAVTNARTALEANPKDIARIIDLGVAQSGARQFREAIATFTSGLEIEPNNALLLRWRGHRYLSVREFDRAFADLSRGSSLDPAIYGNWYHLGIVQYIRGDFAGAAASFAKAQPIAPDAGELAGSTDWLWMSLSRAGRGADAKAMLDRRPDSKPVTNAYTRRLQLYRGEIGPEAVVTTSDTDDVQVATLAYGLGNWYLVRGDKAQARQWFERSIQSGGWPGFGFIVSEVELRRF